MAFSCGFAGACVCLALPLERQPEGRVQGGPEQEPGEARQDTVRPQAQGLLRGHCVRWGSPRPAGRAHATSPTPAGARGARPGWRVACPGQGAGLGDGRGRPGSSLRSPRRSKDLAPSLLPGSSGAESAQGHTASQAAGPRGHYCYFTEELLFVSGRPASC